MKLNKIIPIGILATCLPLFGQTTKTVIHDWSNAAGTSYSMFAFGNGCRATYEVDNNGEVTVPDSLDRRQFLEKEITLTSYGDLILNYRRFYSEAGTTGSDSRPNATDINGNIAAQNLLYTNNQVIVNGRILDTIERSDWRGGIQVLPSIPGISKWGVNEAVPQILKGKAYFDEGRGLTTIYGLAPGTYTVRVEYVVNALFSPIPPGGLYLNINVNKGFLSAALQGLSDSIDDAKDDIATLTDGQEDLKDRVTITETNITNLTNNYEVLKELVDKNVIDIAELQDCVAQLKEQMAAVQADITNIYSLIEGNTTAIENLTTRVTKIEGDVLILDGRVTVLEGDMTILDGRVTKIEGDLIEIDGRVTKIEGDVVTLFEITSSLDGRVTVNEGKITSIESRLTVNEADIIDNRKYTEEEITKLYEFLGSQNDQLKKDLDRVEDKSKIRDWWLAGGVFAGVLLNDLVLNEYGDWNWGHNHTYVYPGTEREMLAQPGNSKNSLRLSGYGEDTGN